MNIVVTKTMVYAVAAFVVVLSLLVGYNAASSLSPQRPVVIEVHATPTPAPNTVVLLIPAIDSNGDGRLAQLIVTMTAGSGKTFIELNPENPVFSDTTQESLKTAVEVAKKYALLDPSKYDLHYSMNAGPSASVGGGSAGAAMSAAAIILLQNRTLRDGVTLTGTITPEGFIGQVGGVVEKAKAARAAGLTRIVVPKGEATAVQSKESCTDEVVAGKTIRRCSTVDIQVNVADEAPGIEVVEANSILDAVDDITVI